MDTNAISAACLTETFIPLLRKSPQPCIVFMTSALDSIGDTPNPAFKYYGIDAPEYGASKAALNMIMATNAVKLKEEGFEINVCCPGLHGGRGGTHISRALFALYQIVRSHESWSRVKTLPLLLRLVSITQVSCLE